jgi:AcrR family transcriptional regulator
VSVAVAGRRPHAPVPPTPARLLDAAEALFASRGFAATSIREITRAAGCNIAGINYHFGSKDRLYREVFARRLAVLRDRHLEGIRARPARQPARTLEAVIAAFSESFLSPLGSEGEGRAVVDLLVREMVEPHLPPDLFRTVFVIPVERALAASFCAAVPGLTGAAARRCVRSLVGQLLHEVHVMRRQVPPPSSAAWRVSLHDTVRHIVRFSAAGTRGCTPKEPS